MCFKYTVLKIFFLQTFKKVSVHRRAGRTIHSRAIFCSELSHFVIPTSMCRHAQSHAVCNNSTFSNCNNKQTLPRFFFDFRYIGHLVRIFQHCEKEHLKISKLDKFESRIMSGNCKDEWSLGAQTLHPPAPRGLDGLGQESGRWDQQSEDRDQGSEGWIRNQKDLIRNWMGNKNQMDWILGMRWVEPRIRRIDDGYQKGDIDPTLMIAGPTVSLRRCLLSFSKMPHSESKRQIQMTWMKFWL